MTLFGGGYGTFRRENIARASVLLDVGFESFTLSLRLQLIAPDMYV